MRWLSRATCGFTTSDHGAFTALGATDEARWAAWLAQQLDPATIVDSACDARLAGAGFTTLNKTAAQLWAAREAVGGSNYFQRMLPIAEVAELIAAEVLSSIPIDERADDDACDEGNAAWAPAGESVEKAIVCDVAEAWRGIR